jgi:hypothetical protein
MIRSERRQAWVGLATVHQHPGAGVLLDRNDAFVNAVALAHTAEEFTELVRGALSRLGFDLVDLEEIEPLAHRRLSYAIPEEMERLAEMTQISATIQFGAFHTWVSDDDETHSGPN